MGKYRTLRGSGIRFDEPMGRCRISDDSRLAGALCLGFGLFAGYVLFFRPDIHGEVTPLIWIFRVIFPFGFGLAGLAMLGHRVRTAFDKRRGEWRRTETAFFRSTVRSGPLDGVRRVLLDAREEEATSHGDSGRSYWRWKIMLSMDLGGEVLALTEWSWRIEGNRPKNEAIVEAKDLADRLAGFIGCRSAYAWEQDGNGSSRDRA